MTMIARSPKIWFTSDEHYGHENIIKWCKRPFRSLKEMDEALIKNHNKLVRPKDLVYHLGDFAYRNKTDYLQQLNGTHYLIQGNHDFHLAGETFGFVWIRPVEFLQIGEQLLWLSHYPHYAWPQLWDKRVWHLYGHLHNTAQNGEPELGLALNMNVELWEYKPVEWNRIWNILRKKEATFPPLSESRQRIASL